MKFLLVFRQRRFKTCIVILPLLSTPAHIYTRDARNILSFPQQRAADGKMVRCMLVADVAAGKAHRTFEKDFPEMTEPPMGYNSVVGEARPLRIVPAG